MSKGNPRLVTTAFSRLLGQSELLGEHKSTGYRVYKADLRHLPIVVPMLKEYYREDPVAKALNMHLEDDYAWPMAYNFLKYPLSVFGVLNNEPVFVSNGFFDCAKNDDPQPKAEYPKMDKSNPMLTFGKFDNYLRNYAIEREGDKKFIIGDVVVLRKQLRQKKLGMFSLICHARSQLKNDMQVDVAYCISTSRANAAALQAIGGLVVGRLPESLYMDNEGKPFRPADGESNGFIVKVPLNEIRKMKMYEDFDKVLIM